MAVNFDGTDDVISCGTNMLFPVNGTSVSISAWINPVNAGAGSAGRIFGQEINANVGPRFYVSNNGGGNIAPRVTIASSVADFNVQTSVQLTANVWSHVLFTWDGSLTASNLHIYINGTEVSYSGQTNGTVFTDNSGATARIADRPTGGRAFNGSITELAIWHSVLSSTDIYLLANSRLKGIPLSISPSNLKAYWPLDDQPNGTSGDGDTFYDLSGNANHGTGNDGANNTGLTAYAEEILSYSADVTEISLSSAVTDLNITILNIDANDSLGSLEVEENMALLDCNVHLSLPNTEVDKILSDLNINSIIHNFLIENDSLINLLALNVDDKSNILIIEKLIEDLVLNTNLYGSTLEIESLLSYLNIQIILNDSEINIEQTPELLNLITNLQNLSNEIDLNIDILNITGLLFTPIVNDTLAFDINALNLIVDLKDSTLNIEKNTNVLNLDNDLFFPSYIEFVKDLTTLLIDSDLEVIEVFLTEEHKTNLVLRIKRQNYHELNIKKLEDIFLNIQKNSNTRLNINKSDNVNLNIDR